VYAFLVTPEYGNAAPSGPLPRNRRAGVCLQVLNGEMGEGPRPPEGHSARSFSKDRVLGSRDRDVLKG
jgi:hypothetical protein